MGRKAVIGELAFRSEADVVGLRCLGVGCVVVGGGLRVLVAWRILGSGFAVWVAFVGGFGRGLAVRGLLGGEEFEMVLVLFWSGGGSGVVVWAPGLRRCRMDLGVPVVPTGWVDGWFGFCGTLWVFVRCGCFMVGCFVLGGAVEEGFVCVVGVALGAWCLPVLGGWCGEERGGGSCDGFALVGGRELGRVGRLLGAEVDRWGIRGRAELCSGLVWLLRGRWGGISGGVAGCGGAVL
ncbi:hypothetical protein Tco_0857976 [Tanacetum coccineum]|uniref:Uncharacterized protein n=1 Tax=Tanacetum coccineum TaxID=301880 RepID=A0ABQ5BBX8_9ASTR